MPTVCYKIIHMDTSLKKLPQILIDLDKKAQELDEILKDVRLEIHNVLWDLMELKTRSDNKKNKSLL